LTAIWRAKWTENPLFDARKATLLINLFTQQGSHRELLRSAGEIVEFEEGKIKRARTYLAEPFEAPQWRAQWVERM
jgi:hypothetical protein